MNLDPFWAAMAGACFFLSLFAPWWMAIICLWCGWEYLKMASD